MSTTRSYTIQGMTCGHCVASVTDEVGAVPGIKTVDVVLETGELTVTGEGPIDEAAVRTAVEEAGYRLP